MYRSLEALLRRDRQIVIAALVLVLLLSWGYLFAGAGTGMDMGKMVGAGADTMASGQSGDSTWRSMEGRPGDTAATGRWRLSDGLMMFLMWWIMMVAMMLPSAAPIILLHARVARRGIERQARGASYPCRSTTPYSMTMAFTLGYLSVWALFSVLATLAQWGLERNQLLSAMMVSTSAVVSACVLIAAGLWQLTPLKHACVKHCRTPLEFLSRHWRFGSKGAFRMGIHHGAYCLGCCWVLMALLFYGGVMNLYWIIGIALYVLVEKTLPVGTWFEQVTGAALLTWGGYVLVNV